LYCCLLYHFRLILVLYINANTIGFAVQASKPRDRLQSKHGSNDKPVCTHCGKLGHERAKCYEIVEYPNGWVRGGRGGCGGGRNRRGRDRAYAHAVQEVNSHGINKQEPKPLILGLFDTQV
jgi:hypothetical protein